MPTTPKKSNIFSSVEGQKIREELSLLEANPAYRTETSFTANRADYPDQIMPFVQKHMLYLSKHAELNPQHYLANLRLKIKIR